MAASEPRKRCNTMPSASTLYYPSTNAITMCLYSVMLIGHSLGLIAYTIMLTSTQSNHVLEAHNNAMLLDMPTRLPLAIKSNVTTTVNADRRSDTRPIFFLHVGPPKTGSTTIQDSLDATQHILKRDKYVFLGMRNPPPTRDTFRVRRGLMEFRNKGNATFLDKLHNELQLHPQNNYIVSAEDFTSMPNTLDKQGLEFFSLLQEKVQGRQVHVALGYRRYYQWIFSVYNQQYKNGRHKQSFVDWYQANTTSSRQSKRQQRHDHKDRLLRTYTDMKKRFPSASVINMHSPRDLMMNVYCNILPNATNTCEWYQKIFAASGKPLRANPSIQLWPDLVTDYAIELGLTTRMKKQMKEHVIKFANRINYTLPLECPTTEMMEDILDRSLKYEQMIIPDFFESPLGEEELRKDFQRVWKENKLCSVNVTHVLQDKQWIGFFARFTPAKVALPSSPGIK